MPVHPFVGRPKEIKTLAQGPPHLGWEWRFQQHPVAFRLFRAAPTLPNEL